MNRIFLLSLFVFFILGELNSQALYIEESSNQYLVNDLIVSYDASLKNSESDLDLSFQNAKRTAIEFIESKKNFQTEIKDEEIDLYILNYKVKSETFNKINKQTETVYSIAFDKIAIDNKVDYENIKYLNSKMIGSDFIKCEIKTSKNKHKWLNVKRKLDKNKITYKINFIDINKIIITFERVKLEKLSNRLMHAGIDFTIEEDLICIN